MSGNDENKKQTNNLHDMKENIIEPSSDKSTSNSRSMEPTDDGDVNAKNLQSSNDQRKPSIDSLEADLSKYLNPIDSCYETYPGAERMNYDFAAERLSAYSTNMIDSTAHLIKGCLGAGLLSMHVGFMYGGIWTSLALTFVIGFIVSHSMMILVRSAQRMYIRLRIPKLSYPDLAEVAFATGPWKCGRRCCKIIRYIIETCLFVEMCGACCVYEIMIAHTIKNALEQVSPAVHSMNMNERLYILCVMGPLILICMIRSLKYLAPFSLAADLFIGTCVLTTIYYSLTSGGSLQYRPAWKSLHGMLKFNGICLYAIDGVAIALPVENNMKKPKYFHIVLQYGMPIVVTSVAATGFFGYWGWGETCRSPITMHMPEKTFPLILQFLMAITLSVTFAVQLWMPFKIIWSYIGRKHKRIPAIDIPSFIAIISIVFAKRGFWERFYKIIHVALITCVSAAYPDLIGIVIFLGNFFIALITLIFPALIECLVCWRDLYAKSKTWLLLKNGLLLAFGMFIMISALYSVTINTIVW